MTMHRRSICSLLAALFIGVSANSAFAQFGNSSGGDVFSNGLEDNPFLPVAQAFVPALRWTEDNQVQLEWDIEPGYYLYRDRFSYQDDKGDLLDASYPQGINVFDEFYQKDLEVYYDQLTTPLVVPEDTSLLYVQFQGCAEAGLCYPPTWVGFDIDMNTGAAGYQGELPLGPPLPANASAAAPLVSTEDADGGLPITLIIGCLGGLLLLIGATIYATYFSKKRT